MYPKACSMKKATLSFFWATFTNHSAVKWKYKTLFFTKFKIIRPNIDICSLS